MPEIGTSGSMSGDGKRSAGLRPQATAPILDSTNSPFASLHASVSFRRFICRTFGDRSLVDVVKGF
jgi:hypothetical protein